VNVRNPNNYLFFICPNNVATTWCGLRASTLILSHRWPHAVPCNETIEQSTHTIGCLLSCLIVIQLSLICAINKEKFICCMATFNGRMGK
jgi:hypothetical protein